MNIRRTEYYDKERGDIRETYPMTSASVEIYGCIFDSSDLKIRDSRFLAVRRPGGRREETVPQRRATVERKGQLENSRVHNRLAAGPREASRIKLSR